MRAGGSIQKCPRGLNSHYSKNALVAQGVNRRIEQKVHAYRVEDVINAVRKDPEQLLCKIGDNIRAQPM